MNAKVREKALKTLDGMEQIVRNEMMKPGKYVNPEVTRPDLAQSGAVCGGKEYCLIGSAWIAYGGAKINPESRAMLVGVGTAAERAKYLRNRPALRAVYDTLNTAADRRIARLGEWDRQRISEALTPDPMWGEEDAMYGGSTAEALFEITEPGRPKLLSLIASARKEIEAA